MTGFSFVFTLALPDKVLGEVYGEVG